MDSLDFARYLQREDARNAELEQDHDGNHPAFTAGSYAEALAIAARQADETGCAWSVLDPWDGSFYVFAAGDALGLFPSSIARTVEPAGAVSLDRTWRPCHVLEPGPTTTDQYRHACGRCGGDRRHPVAV